MRLKNAKISGYKLRKLLRFFCDNLPASRAAKSLKVNVNTTERYYALFRERMAKTLGEEVSEVPLATDSDSKKHSWLFGIGKRDSFKAFLLKSGRKLRLFWKGKPQAPETLREAEAFHKHTARHLAKLQGAPPHKLSLYLRECVFRWKHRDRNLYRVMFALMRRS